MTDVSYFRPYAETKNNEGEQRVCMKWIQFRSWFRPSGAKVYIYIYISELDSKCRHINKYLLSNYKAND